MDSFSGLLWGFVQKKQQKKNVEWDSLENERRIPKKGERKAVYSIDIDIACKFIFEVLFNDEGCGGGGGGGGGGGFGGVDSAI